MARPGLTRAVPYYMGYAIIWQANTFSIQRGFLSMAEFVKVAGLSEVPQGEMKVVELDGKPVVLANVDGEIYAFGGECTHKGGLLGEGELEGDTVICPLHGGEFNVKTGEVLSPPPEEPVSSYQVQVEGDDIKIARP
jgi:nitrite reductase/ring-hydroxylating ferredoxin subunit